MDDSRKPGWYKNDDGASRYWDGQAWHDSKPKKVKEEKLFVLGKLVFPLKFLYLGIAATLVLGVAGGTAAVWSAEQSRIASEEAAEAAAKKAAAAKAAKEKAAEDLEKALREESVLEIEASVKSTAREHQRDGIIDGKKIISVGCDPVGGSLDDLLAATTTFDCFAATKDNGDGTLSGYHYHALMNWETFEYSWGLGKP